MNQAVTTIGTATAAPSRLGVRKVPSGYGPVTILDDLDLDSELDEAVTVVEWGAGLAEGLADERLEITLVADPATEARTLTATGVGARWAGVDVEAHLRDEGSDR